MPRFHFHLSTGSRVVRDADGMELPDLDRAIVEARADCRAFAIDELKAGRPFPLLANIEIGNGDGVALHVEWCRFLLGSPGDQHVAARAAT